MSKNDVTGDALRSKVGNPDKFNEGFDRIWNKTITCARCADFSGPIIKAALAKVRKPTCAAQSCNEV